MSKHIIAKTEGSSEKCTPLSSILSPYRLGDIQRLIQGYKGVRESDIPHEIRLVEKLINTISDQAAENDQMMLDCMEANHRANTFERITRETISSCAESTQATRDALIRRLKEVEACL